MRVLRCGLYPQKGIPTINVLPTGGPDRWHFITEENYVSGVTIEQLVLVDTAKRRTVGLVSFLSCRTSNHHHSSTSCAWRGETGAHGQQTGTAVGHVIALLFAASREAVDVSLRNVIPFMAFVSLLIALVRRPRSAA